MDRTQRPKARPNLKTGEMTPGGRPIWKDKDTGENYSERTTSFDIGGIWYTMPTVAEDGTEYPMESVRNYVLENGPVDFITGEELPTFSSEKEAVDYAIQRSDTRRPNQEDTGFAQGGVTRMKKMYEEGGLATDGMAVDPISGNDIPVGSNAEDVRDDVDAKLSTGEYVIPADVVKYVGVAQLEKLVNKAKDGLEDMAEDGRIGGEPVAEAEEIVMTLGGDLNTLDGYATGGFVPGTDIDGIINRVKAAAMKDPSIINMLKAKGIFVQEPQPQGQLQQNAMAQGAVPQQAAPPNIQGKTSPTAFAEGGFNAAAYAPGFSVAQAAPTVGGYTAPAQVCPPGQEWNAEINACVPVATTGIATGATGAVAGGDANASGGDSDQDAFAAAMMDNSQADPNAWIKKYDYSNPDTVFAETMTSMGFEDPDAEPKNVGFIESITSGLLGKLGMGLVGKAMAVSNVAEANANAILLESRGLDEQASKIRAQVAVYEKEKGIQGWPSAMRNGKGMAERVLSDSEASETVSKWSTNPAVIAASSATKAVPKTSPASVAAVVNTLSRNNSDNNSMNSAQQAQHNAAVAASRDRASQSVAASEEAQGRGPDQPGGRSRTNTSTGEKEETYSSKVSRGGGFAKGGLVKPRASKPSAPKTNTNKKGLGRK